MNLSDVSSKIEKGLLVREGQFTRFGLAGSQFQDGEYGLVYINDLKYLNDILTNANISSVICSNKTVDELEKRFSGGILLTDNPKSTFFSCYDYLSKNTEFFNKQRSTTISHSASIHPSAIIAENNVNIGEHVTICANAIIKENTHISDNVKIMEGCIAASPAFYYYNKKGTSTLVSSASGVIIKESVELHPYTLIQTGVFSPTIIEAGVKIDGDCMIGHDSHIMHNCKMAGKSVCGAYTIIGENTFVGGHSTTIPHLSIGENCKIGAGTVVLKSISNNSFVLGNPARFVNYICNCGTILDKSDANESYICPSCGMQYESAELHK
jgi:UDP-3-O-[3-hydroxymyristoyl] glucosamine N-acyltransferase